MNKERKTNSDSQTDPCEETRPIQQVRTAEFWFRPLHSCWSPLVFPDPGADVLTDSDYPYECQTATSLALGKMWAIWSFSKKASRLEAMS